MSAFAGVVNFSGRPVDWQTEDRIARALLALRKGRVASRRLKRALFVEYVQSSTTTQQGESRPPTGSGQTLSAAYARLDNRAELADALGLEPSTASQTSDASLIERMHARWGDGGLAQCLGAFAFAMWDDNAQRLILARDCLGDRPLFFYRSADFVAFATSLGMLFGLPGVPRAIDEYALAQFIAVNNSELRRTFYQRIERVPSRTVVAIDRDNIHHRQYWFPNLDCPPPYRREEDYVERARELLDQAVSAATRDTPHVAITTSGGLDSSAIAATAARLGSAESITCFSVVAPPGTDIDVGPWKYLDERHKVEALGRMHPSLGIRFISPENDHPIEEDHTRYFVRANLPAFGPVGLGVGAHLCDAIVDAGHHCALNGSRGNFGLSWNGQLSLVELIRTLRWRTFASEMSATARNSGRSLLSTFKTDLLGPLAPRWLRRFNYRLKGRDPFYVGRYSALNPTFIADNDLVRRWRQEGFDPWFGARHANAARWRAYRLFDHNQYGRDIRGLGQEIVGFESRDPHGDRRLLEFTLSVPEPMFRRNGIPRSFARRVLADRLPKEILEEGRRGMITPTWFRSLDSRRQDIAREIDRLEASPLARKLIDLPRLKRLMVQWPKDANDAQRRLFDFRLALARGVHVGRFIRWVEGGNT